MSFASWRKTESSDPARRVAARGRGRVFSGTGRSPRHRPRSGGEAGGCGGRRVRLVSSAVALAVRVSPAGQELFAWAGGPTRTGVMKTWSSLRHMPPGEMVERGRMTARQAIRPLVVAGPPAAVEPRQPGDGAGPLEFSGRWGCAAGARGLRRRSSCAFRLLRNPTAAVRDRPELARLRVAPRPVTVPARDRRRAPPSRPCRGGMRRRARIPRPLVHARATTADRLVVGSGARPSRARPSLERSPLPGLRARRPQDHLGAQPASTLAGSRPSLLAHG